MKRAFPRDTRAGASCPADPVPLKLQESLAWEWSRLLKVFPGFGIQTGPDHLFSTQRRQVVGCVDAGEYTSDRDLMQSRAPSTLSFSCLGWSGQDTHPDNTQVNLASLARDPRPDNGPRPQPVLLPVSSHPYANARGSLRLTTQRSREEGGGWWAPLRLCVGRVFLFPTSQSS
jgi:hypothetical protein